MKHSIKIYLHSDNKQSDLKPIRLRVSFMGLRVDLRTGVAYEEKNFKDGRAKNGTYNAHRQSAFEINTLISRQIEFIDKYFIECDLRNSTPYPAELKNTFDAEFKEHKGKCKEDIFTLFDKFLAIHEKDKQLSYQTINNYMNVKINLKKMCKNLKIKDLTADFLNTFKDFLCQKGHKNTTIKHSLAMLKTFLNYLKSEHYINFDFKGHSTVKLIKGDTQSFLTHEELKRLYNFKIDILTEVDKSMQIAKDCFLLGCFTGLRYSDLFRLKKSSISSNYIEIIIKKTAKKVVIDLNKYSREIIDKYTEQYPNLPTLFPSMCCKYYNNLLHRLFKECGFDNDIILTYYKSGVRIEETKKKYEILSSHSARRTFVVECLRKGIAPLVIIKWTGHSNLETLRPYIAIVDELKKSEMQKFDSDL